MHGVSYKHRDMFVPLACIERCKKMREVWYLESANPGSTSGFNVFPSMSLGLIVSLVNHS